MSGLGEAAVHPRRGDLEPIKVNALNRQLMNQLMGDLLAVVDVNQTLASRHINEDTQNAAGGLLTVDELEPQGRNPGFHRLPCALCDQLPLPKQRLKDLNQKKMGSVEPISVKSVLPRL
jgi:hypothetical protein